MNKKILLAVFIVVVAIAAIFVVATKNQPVAHEPEKSNEITNVPEPTVVPEVTEEPTEPVTAPADENLFDGEVTGSTPESTVETDVTDVDRDAIDDLIMSDPTVVAWGKPIEYTIPESTTYEGDDSTFINVIIHNSDSVCCLIETNGNYESLGVVNVYGSDYANIYWENEKPLFGEEIYEELYDNQLSSTYIGTVISDDELSLTNCSTGEVVSMYSQDGKWYVKKSGDNDE